MGKFTNTPKPIIQMLQAQCFRPMVW